MKWKDHNLVSASVKSLSGGTCKMKTKIPMRIAGLKVKPQRTANGYVVEFETKKGNVYQLSSLK